MMQQRSSTFVKKKDFIGQCSWRESIHECLPGEKLMKKLWCKAVSIAVSPLILALAFFLTQAPASFSQTHVPPEAQTAMASDAGVSGASSPDRPAVVLDPEMLVKKLAEMEARIAQLEEKPIIPKMLAGRK